MSGDPHLLGNDTVGGDVEINQAFAEAVELNTSHQSTLVSTDNENLTSIADANRPRRLADDSAQSITGSRQATISEICTLGSINWAEPMVKMTSSNSSSTITMVSPDRV